MTNSRRMLEGRSMYTDHLPVNINRVHENFYLEQHTHDFIEIIYVEQGVGYHYIEDELVRVQRGDVFYLPVGISHVFRPTGQPPSPELVVYNCVIEPAYLKQLCIMHDLNLPMAHLNGNEGKAWYSYHDYGERFGTIFRSMYEEYVSARPGCKQALAGWLLLLHVALLQSRESDKQNAGSGEAAFEKSLAWLEEHLHETITMEKTAEVARLSPRHFYRLFKRRTGKTFLAYVQGKRIAHSCMLLETTSRSVADILESSGYRDMKSFLRTFKLHTGCTPSEYRRLKR